MQRPRVIIIRKLASPIHALQNTVPFSPSQGRDPPTLGSSSPSAVLPLPPSLIISANHDRYDHLRRPVLGPSESHNCFSGTISGLPSPLTYAASFRFAIERYTTFCIQRRRYSPVFRSLRFSSWRTRRHGRFTLQIASSLSTASNRRPLVQLTTSSTSRLFSFLGCLSPVLEIGRDVHTKSEGSLTASAPSSSEIRT